MARSTRKPTKPRTLKAIRADAPRQDQALPALAAAPPPPTEPPALKPLNTVPWAIAQSTLDHVAAEFGDDAKAVADMILWDSISHWWGREHRQWGHQQASMNSAEAGYRLKGQPSRLDDAVPAEARAAYHIEAAKVRAAWEAADCPGLLDNLEPTLAWVRLTIQKRNAA